MTPKENSWSIVVVGYWNRMIFTPKWVGKEIFKAPSVERLVSMAPVTPVIYRNDDITIAIGEEKLDVMLRKLNITCMKDAEQKVKDILTSLPHTPISAIGVNFGFIEENREASLLKLFNYQDDPDIAASDNYEILRRQLTRQLSREGKILNLTLSFDGSRVEFDANFNHPVDSAQKAREVIDNQTENMYNRLTTLLEKVYKLKL
jgi:hypothetical protein